MIILLFTLKPAETIQKKTTPKKYLNLTNRTKLYNIYNKFLSKVVLETHYETYKIYDITQQMIQFVIIQGLFQILT